MIAHSFYSSTWNVFGLLCDVFANGNIELSGLTNDSFESGLVFRQLGLQHLCNDNAKPLVYTTKCIEVLTKD